MSNQKRLCTCGCLERVTARTEARHLELREFDNLLAAELNGSRFAPTFSDAVPPVPSGASRKRKRNPSTNVINQSRKRTNHRTQLDEQPIDQEFDRPNEGNLGEHNPEHLGFEFPDLPPPPPTLDTSLEAPQPASAGDSDAPLADTDEELTRLRRSARIEANLQYLAQRYPYLDQEQSAPAQDSDDDNDGTSSNEEDEEDEEGEEDEEDTFGADEEINEWSSEESWTLPVAPAEVGLSLSELLDQDFLKEMAELDGKRLDDSNIRLLQAYVLKTEDGLANRTFERLRFLVPEANIATFKQTEARVQALSGFKPVRYDCCPNSCICYTHNHAELVCCPYCKTDRYKSATDRTPRAYFEYLPITPRLCAMVANRDCAEKMKYRKDHSPNPEKITDVFDGSHYRELLTKPVVVASETMPFCHFLDERDIALGLSTDGFTPFKGRKKTAWPLVLFNYNLPPEERFSKRNMLSAGVIPGPNKPKDMDSFLWPLIRELIHLSIGVSAFDALHKAVFLLRAFLILVFGDIPAISTVMKVKGQNGCSPCRMCEIAGICVPNSGRKKTYYVPLNQAKFPNSPPSYDPRNLPHRTHEKFIAQGRKVLSAKTQAAAETLATECGIKGVPMLSCLSSLSFPASFPYDFMHLIWCNLIKNLIKFWTGTFKCLDHSKEAYRFNDGIWEEIGKATAAAGSHIPSAFGSRVPDVAADRSHLISETYSNWTLYMSPIVLRNRFVDDRYYKHHLQLVDLLKTCLEYEFDTAKIQKIEEGFTAWVEKYEL